MSRLVFVLLASLVAVAYGQTFNWGGCPNVKPLAAYDAVKGAGKYYQFSRTINAYETTGICNTLVLSVNGTSMNVTNKQIDGVTQADKLLIGSATITANASSADVTYPNGKNNMKVLATDYTSYLIVHSCQNFFFFSFSNTWTYTRDRFPAQGVKDSINASLIAQGFDVSKFNATEQFWCPIWGY